MLGLALVLAQQPGGPEPPRAAGAPPSSAPARHALRGAAEEGLQAKGGLRPGRQGVPADVRERGRLRSHPEEQAEGVEEVVQARGLCRGRRRLRLRGLHGRRPGCRGLRGLLGLRGGRRHRRQSPEDPRRLPTVTYCEGLPKKVCNKKPGCINVKGHGCQRTYENGANCEAIPKKKKKWCRNAGCVVKVAYEYDYDYGDYDYSLKKTKFCTYPLV